MNSFTNDDHPENHPTQNDDEFMDEIRRLFPSFFPDDDTEQKPNESHPSVSTNVRWLIGRETFGMLHRFHWDDHPWTERIPDVALIENYESLVRREHPGLLREDCCLVV